MAHGLGHAIHHGGAGRLAVWSKEFVRYFGVSLAALALDAALLFGLTETTHMGYLAASAVSYSCGAILHYVLSVSLVFDQRRMSHAGAEFALYILVGVFGLLVTQLMLTLSVGVFGLNYMAGKVAAVAVSFVMNYGLRRVFLFTAALRPVATVA